MHAWCKLLVFQANVCSYQIICCTFKTLLFNMNILFMLYLTSVCAVWVETVLLDWCTLSANFHLWLLCFIVTFIFIFAFILKWSLHILELKPHIKQLINKSSEVLASMSASHCGYVQCLLISLIMILHRISQGKIIYLVFKCL